MGLNKAIWYQLKPECICHSGDPDSVELLITKGDRGLWSPLVKTSNYY